MDKEDKRSKDAIRPSEIKESLEKVIKNMHKVMLTLCYNF